MQSAWSCLESLHISLVLSVCGCVPFLCQLLSIYIELHDCDLASNLICFLFYSLSAHCIFHLSNVLLVRREALCCRAPHHPGPTMAEQAANPTKSKFICFDQMQWFDELSCCRLIFVFVRDAKCELLFPWNSEMIFLPLLHLYFTVSLRNNLVYLCPFLFALNSTQTSDTKHFPGPSSVPCLFLPCHLSLSLSPSLHHCHARLTRT